MKFVRYEAHGEIEYGVVNGNVVNKLTQTPFEKYEVTEHTHLLSQIKLLTPCSPGKIVAIAMNYHSHLGEKNAPLVPEPFFKTPSSVINPMDDIVIPHEAVKVQEEAELSVVIGHRCKGVTKNNALDYVLGYTCGNDVSERNWQSNDVQWWRGKSSDTFAPLGPLIVTDLDPGNLQITGRIGNRVVQDSNTSHMIHDVPTIIEFISRVVTLEPGDIIMTGTPGEPQDINPGDIVEIEIEGIGTLKNPVRAE